MWTALIPLWCSLTNQNQDKKPNQGSLEDLSQDQPDQALPFSEPINIQRRSPMIRSRKTGSMEVPDVWFHLYVLRLAARGVDYNSSYLSVFFFFFVNGETSGPYWPISVLTPQS